MPSNFPRYSGQAFVPSGESAAQQPSPEERLAGMAQLLPNGLLEMLTRLLQKPMSQQQPTYGNGPWQTMYPMPPPPNPMFNGINGAMPMRPSEPPQEMPMHMPSSNFIRG